MAASTHVLNQLCDHGVSFKDCTTNICADYLSEVGLLDGTPARPSHAGFHAAMEDDAEAEEAERLATGELV